MKIINKDILTVESGVICHQVNCQGVMGSGLAKSIRAKWPQVYTDYVKFCNSYKYDFERLGEAQFIKVGENLWVCNIFGQLNYGTGERQTDYAALKSVFKELPNSKLGNQQFYFPYLFSSNLAGGNWNIVSKMIDYYLPDAIVCKI